MGECYVDYIAVKSHSKSNHLGSKNCVRYHEGSPAKMNLTKSFLEVPSGKFLEFIVTFKKIHLDPDKVKAIQSMQPPKTLKELRGL